MDGNRRYAKKVHLDQWNCYNLGFEKIRNVSVGTFSDFSDFLR